MNPTANVDAYSYRHVTNTKFVDDSGCILSVSKRGGPHNHTHLALGVLHGLIASSSVDSWSRADIGPLQHGGKCLVFTSHSSKHEFTAYFYEIEGEAWEAFELTFPAGSGLVFNDGE